MRLYNECTLRADDLLNFHLHTFTQHKLDSSHQHAFSGDRDGVVYKRVCIGGMDKINQEVSRNSKKDAHKKTRGNSELDLSTVFKCIYPICKQFELSLYLAYLYEILALHLNVIMFLCCHGRLL